MQVGTRITTYLRCRARVLPACAAAATVDTGQPGTYAVTRKIKQLSVGKLLAEIEALRNTNVEVRGNERRHTHTHP